MTGETILVKKICKDLKTYCKRWKYNIFQKISKAIYKIKSVSA